MIVLYCGSVKYSKRTCKYCIACAHDCHSNGQNALLVKGFTQICNFRYTKQIRSSCNKILLLLLKLPSLRIKVFVFVYDF